MGKNLQYFLLSATNPPLNYASLHDRVFCSWLDVIQKAFEETNNKNIHLHEDFIRQNVVGALCYQDEIVATFLHSFSSTLTQATRTYRYFSGNYPPEFFEKLTTQKIYNVLSVHYLAVNPAWRKSRTTLNIAPIMLGLAQRIRDHHKLDALIGVYRRDRNVHQVAYSLGGECVIENVDNHNTPCDLIVMRRGQPYQYPSGEVGDHISYLWNNRIDTLALFNQESGKNYGPIHLPRDQTVAGISVSAQ